MKKLSKIFMTLALVLILTLPFAFFGCQAETKRDDVVDDVVVGDLYYCESSRLNPDSSMIDFVVFRNKNEFVIVTDRYEISEETRLNILEVDGYMTATKRVVDNQNDYLYQVSDGRYVEVTVISSDKLRVKYVNNEIIEFDVIRYKKS